MCVAVQRERELALLTDLDSGWEEGTAVVVAAEKDSMQSSISMGLEGDWKEVFTRKGKETTCSRIGERIMLPDGNAVTGVGVVRDMGEKADSGTGERIAMRLCRPSSSCTGVGLRSASVAMRA